jgi:hypothetical protein
MAAGTTVSLATQSSMDTSHDGITSSGSANRSYEKAITIQQQYEGEDEVSNILSRDVGMEIICSIPCYCDIQFSRREFLTVLKHPNHPFAHRIEKLAEEKQIKT